MVRRESSQAYRRNPNSDQAIARTEEIGNLGLELTKIISKDQGPSPVTPPGEGSDETKVNKDETIALIHQT